jgi:hypothetical protein
MFKSGFQSVMNYVKFAVLSGLSKQRSFLNTIHMEPLIEFQTVD